MIGGSKRNIYLENYLHSTPYCVSLKKKDFVRFSIVFSDLFRYDLLTWFHVLSDFFKSFGSSLFGLKLAQFSIKFISQW